MARTVLVVDDEPVVLDVTASMLEELGCEVVTAANALDALTMLRANQAIEVLLTDINMPGVIRTGANGSEREKTPESRSAVRTRD